MAYSGIDPGLISPYRAKSRKYQRIGDLFKTFGDIRQQKFLRDRQAAADERSIAEHGSKMDVYRARLAEYARAAEIAKRNEEARFKTDQEFAKNEAIARGNYWKPTFGYGDGLRGDYPDQILRGAGKAQGMVDKEDAPRLIQYGMLPGQTPWPSEEKYLESLAARHRAGRGTSPELAQVLSRLANMRATEALGEGRKAKNIRDAIGGMGISGDDLYSQSSRLSSLTETVEDAINRHKYNQFATEDGENVGINQAEKHELMQNLNDAAAVVMQRDKLSRAAAINKIIQNIEIAKPLGEPTGTEWNWANAFPFGEPLRKKGGFQDFVPKTANQMLTELYGGMAQPGNKTSAEVVSKNPDPAGPPGSRDNPIILKSPEDIDKLGPGVYFKDPRGDVYGPTPG
jgi:hypothetical protein